MKKYLLGLVLLTSISSLAAPEAMKLKINDAESLYKASVTAEQMTQNVHTLHILNGKVVSRDLAKDAFLNGATSCRVFLGGSSEQLKSKSIVDLVMEVPSQNRKMLGFVAEDQKNMFVLTCQASNGDITRESILKTLGSLVEVVK